jgi:hypothetical protein
LLLKAHVEYLGFEDIKSAYSATSQFTPLELQLEDEAAISVVIALSNREPEAAIRILEAFPHDFIGGGGYGHFPVRSWIGEAREMEGQPDAAQVQWQVALQLVQDRLKTAPNDLQLIGNEAILFSRLGQTEDARHSLQLLQNLTPGGLQGQRAVWQSVMAILGEKEKLFSELTAEYESKDDGWPETHANIRFMPWFDSLRGEPRFEKLLRDTLPPGAKPFDQPGAMAEPGR